MNTGHSVFLDRDSVDRGDIDFSNLDTVLPGLASFGSTAPAHTLDRVRKARVIISNKVVVDTPIFAACTELELIVVAATGTNNIDLDAAKARGIPVCNVRNYGTSSVSQHVFSLILSLSRNLNPYKLAVRDGLWNQSPFFCLLDYPIEDLEGRTLGIIGHGTLGSAVAKLGKAFGMALLIGARPGASSGGNRITLEELLERSDVVSLHCPLVPETHHLIGAKELKRMKSDAILVNTARGGIVDEHALAEALRNGDIGGAGIDVLSVEPPDGTSPLSSLDLPNLILTPHIAWASRRCRQTLVDQMADIIQAWLKGNPINRVA